MRFSEFDEAWNRSSLSKVSFPLEYGIGASAVDFDGKNRYIRITDISNYTEEQTMFVSPSFIDEKALLKNNDILLARTGATVGDSFIYKEKNDYRSYYAGFLIRARINNNNPGFVYYQLKTNRYKKWVKIMSARSGQPGINSQEYGSFTLFLPHNKEQDKIALLMTIIDERIETQSKIIEKLESLKIGIKERIYLLGKTKEPLERILHEVSEKSTVQNQYPVLSSTVKGLFLQSEYFDRAIASENNIGYKIVHKGQIIISPQNLWMGNLTFNDKYESGIVSPSYKIYEIDSKYSKKYIHWLLTSKRSFFNYGLVSEQGASIVRRNLNIDAFMELCLPIIKDNDDESKIEKLIDLIEKKLESEKKRGALLNQQKQFLLSNLFI